MPQPVPVVGKLRLSWRGLTLPVTSRSLTFSHVAAEHSFEYADSSITELTAGGNMRFRYTVPMSDGVTKAPYNKLFSNSWILLLNAMRDRSPDFLTDPILGIVRVKPITMIDEASAQRLDGTDITLEFEEAPDLDEVEVDLQGDGSSDALIAESHEIDREVAKQPWEQGAPQLISNEEVVWEQAEPPEPTINPIDLVSGLVRQGSRMVTKTKAVFGDTVFRLQKLEMACDEAKDPKLYSIRADARRLRLIATRSFNRQQSSSRPLRVTRLPRDMNPMVAASFVGMSYSDFTQLNPSLASKLELEQGTTVKHFK